LQPIEYLSDASFLFRTVVSLTSFPERINAVQIAINSIVNGSIRPDKIVLYLAKTQFYNKDIKLQNCEIRWLDTDIRSFKKLIPALTDFPDQNIITIDDDLIYPKKLVQNLLKTHTKYPNAICGARVKRVDLDSKYKAWKLVVGGRPELYNLATTGAGALFPVGAFDDTVKRDDIFMEICPTTDDLWFWFMAKRCGTKTVASKPYWNLCEINGTSAFGLWRVNNRGEMLNDKNIEKLKSLVINDKQS